MEYKPAPGEPYRPVISAPSRLSSLLPEWSKSSCIISAALFNGVDPPRALKPAEILTPRVTQALSSASVAAVAAPASGIRANEPSKTLNPSSRGGKEASVPSDPDTSESGSELSDPSSSDPNPADSENTDPNAFGSEDSDIAKSTPNNAPPQDIRPGVHDPMHAATDSGDSDIEESTSNNAGPQDTGPSVHDPEISAIDFSTTNPKPLVPGNPDTKHANSPSSSSQDTDHQALNAHNKPEEVDGPSLELSKSDGANASSSSPDPSHPNAPDNPSDMADPSNGSSKDPPSDDYKPHSSDSDGDNIPNSEAQEAGAADPDSHNVDSVLGESKYSNSQGQDTAIAHPNKSPAAKPKATNGDSSDVKGPDAELNLFDVLPTKLSDINKLTSPTAKPGVGQHATPNDPERISSSQPGNSKVPQSENDLNEIEALFDTTFSPQETAKVLSTAHSGAVIDLPSKIAPAHDSTASPQKSANDTPIADSDKFSKSPSKTAPTGDLASATDAVGISEKTGVASSSATTASIAALDLHLGSGGVSDNKQQGDDMNAADSSEVKSSGSSLLASRRQPESDGLLDARELLYDFCIYVSPWLLILV